jgi:hypothetical protein
LSYSFNRISIYNYLVEDHTCFIEEGFKQEKECGSVGEKNLKEKLLHFAQTMPPSPVPRAGSDC